MEIIPPAYKAELKWLSEILYNLNFHKNRLSQRWGKHQYDIIVDVINTALSEVLEDLDEVLEHTPEYMLSSYKYQTRSEAEAVMDRSNLSHNITHGKHISKHPSQQLYDGYNEDDVYLYEDYN